MEAGPLRETMNITIVHRVLAFSAVLLACYAYFGQVQEPRAYYLKLFAFALILLAVVLRAVERRRQRGA